MKQYAVRVRGRQLLTDHSHPQVIHTYAYNGEKKDPFAPDAICQSSIWNCKNNGWQLGQRIAR
jgi:hypothetical protein